MNMSEKEKTKQNWTCFICQNVKNNRRETFCSCCQAKRPKDKFGININDNFFLCRITYAKKNQILTYTKAFPEYNSKYVVNLEENSGTLLERVTETIKQHESEMKEILVGNSIPDNTNITDKINRNDLFTQVMISGNEYGYNANIGQFVHIDTLKDMSEDEKKLVMTDLKYIKFMEREKNEMAKIVQIKLESRTHVDESPDMFKERNTEWMSKEQCALCTYTFPVNQLLGVTTIRAVHEWLKNKGHIVSNVKLINSYNKAKLCLFCTQFFDTNITDLFGIQSNSARQIKKSKFTMNGIRKIFENESSPSSVILATLSVAELKLRAECNSRRRFVSEVFLYFYMYPCTLVSELA